VVRGFYDKHPSDAETTAAAADLLTPTIDDQRAVIHVDLNNPTLHRFASQVLEPEFKRSQQRGQGLSKMNDMKQIGLAAHVFADTHDFLPGHIVDSDGKPLLSWRVAILPYIEQQELFEKFHLDEPWDSPHNLAVAKQAAPEVYCHGNHAGMTTYLRPVYEGSDLAAARGDTQPIEKKLSDRRFFLQPGDKFRDINDGTGNTIMVAEVASEHAVFWTKPEDWEVDRDDPLAKLRTNKREGFVTGYFDGSARFEPFNIDPGLLKKLVTKSGGEPIER
jgi:hypothetical protein